MRSDSAKDPNPSRRLLLAAAGAVGVLVGLRDTGLLYAQTSEAPAPHPGFSPAHVFPDEPLAKSLGYKENASEVDKAKFPTYKAGQICANCRFFQGEAGNNYGACQIFSGKLVTSNGWCSSYNAKA
jgi:hypothetical protein